MTSHWDFYFTRVDDQPASIYLDLGVAAQAPRAAYPELGYVRIPMLQPREDGLSSNEEFAALGALEDHLGQALCADDRACFVGRNTSAGCRDFFFYVQPGADWPLAVSRAMAQQDYDYEAGSNPDPQWQSYFGFLYPDDEALQAMRNRGVLHALEEAGDALVAPRPIRHWAYFPHPSDRDRYVDQARTLGFTVVTVDEGDATTGRASCLALMERQDVPGHGTINMVCMPLFHMARQCNGDYDGWECQVVGSEDAS